MDAGIHPTASSFVVMTARGMPEPRKRGLAPLAPIQRSIAPAVPAADDNVAEQSAKGSKKPSEVTITPNNLNDDGSGSDSEDELSQHLAKCAEAVAELSSMIEQATERWQSRRRYTRHGLTPAFQATHKAMKKLWAYEVDLELSSGDESPSPAIPSVSASGENLKSPYDWKTAYQRSLSPGGRRVTHSGSASPSAALSDQYRYERHSSYKSSRTSDGQIPGVVPISTQTYIDVPPGRLSARPGFRSDVYSGRPPRDVPIEASTSRTRRFSVDPDRGQPISSRRRAKASNPVANRQPTPPALDVTPANDDSGEITCICGFRDDDGCSVACDSCNTWQHQQCYFPEYKNQFLPDNLEHFCVECKPRPLDAAVAKARQIARREEEANRIKLRSRGAKKKPKKPGPINSWSLDTRRDDQLSLDDVEPSRPPRTQPALSITLPDGFIITNPSDETQVQHQVNPPLPEKRQPRLTLATPLGSISPPQSSHRPASSIHPTPPENTKLDDYSAAGRSASEPDFEDLDIDMTAFGVGFAMPDPKEFGAWVEATSWMDPRFASKNSAVSNSKDHDRAWLQLLPQPVDPISVVDVGKGKGTEHPSTVSPSESVQMPYRASVEDDKDEEDAEDAEEKAVSILDEQTDSSHWPPQKQSPASSSAHTAPPAYNPADHAPRPENRRFQPSSHTSQQAYWTPEPPGYPPHLRTTGSDGPDPPIHYARSLSRALSKEQKELEQKLQAELFEQVENAVFNALRSGQQPMPEISVSQPPRESAEFSAVDDLLREWTVLDV